MNFIVKIPQNLKYKRFSKRFSKISKVSENVFHVVNSTSNFICGLKCLEGGFVKASAMHQYILLLRRCIGKGRVGWSRLKLFLNIRCPITEKSSGHRMGKGKGAIRFWGVPLREGSFLFKIKLSPFKFNFIDSVSWSFLYAISEFTETYNIIVFSERNISDYRSRNLLLVKDLNTLFFHHFLNYFNTQLRFNKRMKETVFFSRLSIFNLNIEKKLIKLFPVGLNLHTIKKFIFCIFIYIVSSFRNKKFKSIYSKLKNKLNLQKIKVMKTILLSLYKMEYPFFKSINSTSDIYDSVLDFELPFIESKAYLEQFQKYPDIKVSYIPSLMRGLSRVKKKLPFRSEVVFFNNKTNLISNFRSKRSHFKHINQK